MMVCGTARARGAVDPIGRCRATMVGTAAMLAVWGSLAASAVSPPSPAASLRIPLGPLGYQPVAQDFLLQGDSALTVHFVDTDHLLITFAVRRLMKREPDPLPGDEDRTIAAVLVELPSGNVLARTEWRGPDRLQYLLGLGHGR